MTHEEHCAKHIAIYCRVSTDEQVRVGISLDEQQARLKAYCQAMGWTQSVTLFIDDGYSAKNVDRPALKELLGHVEQGTISKLMVTKLDRLSRRLLDLLTLIELFHQFGVSFVSISESFDTDTPSGRLTLQVLGAVAEFERERIRERVIDNMTHAAKSGKWLTQHPYGYRIEEKSLMVYEPEAEHVRRIFRMFLEDGISYLRIAKQLNESGVPSRYNKQWSIRSVKLLLSNPAYMGTLVWNRVDSSQGTRALRKEDDWITIENAHPAIIEASVWQAVQRKIAQNKKVASRSKSSPHLLSGLLVCRECGSAMTIGWSGWPKRRRVYRCSANKNKGVCSNSTYLADDVEERFFGALSELLNHIERPPYSVKVQGMDADTPSRLRKRAKTARSRYSRQVEAYSAGLIELDELKKCKEEMEQVIQQTEKLLDRIPNNLERELEKMLHNFQFDITRFLRNCPSEIARAKTRELVRKVIIMDSGELELVLNIN